MTAGGLTYSDLLVAGNIPRACARARVMVRPNPTQVAPVTGRPMPRADIAIVTVIPEEYQAVLAALERYGCRVTGIPGLRGSRASTAGLRAS